MQKQISNRLILISITPILLFILAGFFYPDQFMNMFSTYWPAVLVLIGILQTLNTRFKDLASAVLLMLTGMILLIFKLKVLSIEFLLSSWDGSLKELILSVFEWLFTFAQ